MHVSANTRRRILIKILEDAPKEVEEKPLEEESQIAEPESIENPSPTSPILDPEPPEKEKTPILDFMLEFEDELFDEYGDTHNKLRLDSPSISIHCQINKAPFDALYNPIVGVNIMSASFAHDLLKDMTLTPTTKLLKKIF